MEPMFENSYVRTRKIHKEFYRYFCFRRPLMIAVYILFGVSLAANLVSFFCGQGSVAAGVPLFPLVFALQLWQYFRMVKTQVKRDLECNNGQELTVRMGVTTHAIITYHTNGATSQVGLLQVQKVVKTKNLILLMTHAKMFYLFPKSTFTKGTAQEFLQFLNDWYHLK